MATFIYKKGPGTYLKTREIHIDSSTDKSNPDQSDFQFDVILKDEIQDVLSMTISSWNIDKDITPSFWPQNGSIAGNDMLDFEITNSAYNGGNPVQLSVQLPNRNLYYDENAPDDSNICEVLQDLMNDAIAAYDPVGLADLSIVVPYLQPQKMTIVTDTTNFGSLDDTTFISLLFASGPNSDRSCYAQLGFEKSDYDSIPAIAAGFASLNNGGRVVISPSAPDLQTFKYIDVLVKESNKIPVQRIFATNPSVFRTNKSASTLRQQKIDTDQPPRVLRKLSISILFPGSKNPAFYVSQSSPLQFTFSILQLAQENDSVPSYLKQTLSM